MVVATEGKQNEVKDFTDAVGGNGKWQKRIFVMICFSSLVCAWHTLVMAFLAPNIEYWCAKPPEYAKVPTDVWRKYGVPKASTNFPDVSNQCKRYKYVNFTYFMRQDVDNETSSVNWYDDGSLISCKQWEYNTSVYTNTIVNQWDLVCEKSWTVSMTNSVFMAGSLISVIVFGHISDKFGRRPAFMITLFLLVTSGVTCAFSTSYVMFAITRFFEALGAGGAFLIGFIILMEAVGTNCRSAYGIGIEFGWCLGYVVLPFIAWLLTDWFWIQLAITLPCIALIAAWWLVPESPRWLLTQQKTEEARDILHKAAKLNKRNVQDLDSVIKKLSSQLEKDEEEKQGGTLLDLFRTPGLWQKTLNLLLNWFVNSFVYYGLSFNTNDLAGDPYVNFAISGAVEFPAYLISVFVIRSLGRRIPLMATMVCGGLACLLTVPLTGDLEWVRVPLAMFGKFCITASYAIVYVYTAEIFPTVVRNTGVGVCSMTSRIGSILAPFVKELGKATHPAVPLACYGGLSVVSGLLILILPETNRCKVPDTLQEAADFGRSKKQVDSNCQEKGEVPLTVYNVNEFLNQTNKDADSCIIPEETKGEIIRRSQTLEGK